jgi:hypothetical protein
MTGTIDVFQAMDFFSHAVWSWAALVLSYLLSFIHFSRHLLRLDHSAIEVERQAA